MVELNDDFAMVKWTEGQVASILLLVRRRSTAREAATDRKWLLSDGQEIGGDKGEDC